MAKLFVLSVRYQTCSHSNDYDFRFCRRCGYNRKQLYVRKTKAVNVDLGEIDKRLQQLTNFDQVTSYSKQKDSLQKELKNFLTAISGNPSVATVTPRDLRRFLIFKDRH